MTYDPYSSLRRRPWQPVVASAPTVIALMFAAILSLGAPQADPVHLRPAQPHVKPHVKPASLADGPKAPAAVTGPATVNETGYLIRSSLPDNGPLKHGEWAWDESKAPKVGPMLILVDVGTQTLSVFRDGHEIGYSTIIYGADHKRTPLGRFPIKAKLKDHWSSIYADAPMPYTLRMTDGGVAIHGSEHIDPKYATNGCVGLPIAFAEKLFGVVKVGDLIIVKENSGLNVGQRVPTKA